jgi:esterase
MVTTGYIERDITANGLKLHYQDWGTPGAPPILMLHGFGVSGHMFDEFAERMRDTHRLIALDQRGHGDSDWSEEGDYTRDAFVADIEAAREQLGLDRFVLVGHSMGGLNAVAYTVRHPERVKALVLVDVGPEAAKEGVDNIMRFTQGPDELEFDEFVELAHRFNPRRSIENIRDRMRTRLRQTEGGKWTWKFDKRFRQKDSGLRVGSELSNDESWQLFRQVRVPTLLVRGSESDVLTEEVAQRAAREMPQARLVTVAGAGHSVPGDNPDDFTAAVREFLQDVEAGRFQPLAAAEPPPLADAVEQAAPSRRGGSLITLLLMGVGAALAISGIAYLASGRKKKEKGIRAKARRATRRVRKGEAPIDLDLQQAQRRAADLAHELALLGSRGVRQARGAVAQVDVEPARRAALDVLHVLEERTEEAGQRAREAVKSVDTRKLRRRGKKAAKTGRKQGDLFLKTALSLAPMVIGRLAAGEKKKQKRSRRLGVWPR